MLILCNHKSKKRGGYGFIILAWTQKSSTFSKTIFIFQSILKPITIHPLSFAYVPVPRSPCGHIFKPLVWQYSCVSPEPLSLWMQDLDNYRPANQQPGGAGSHFFKSRPFLHAGSNYFVCAYSFKRLYIPLPNSYIFYFSSEIVAKSETQILVRHKII